MEHKGLTPTSNNRHNNNGIFLVINMICIHQAMSLLTTASSIVDKISKDLLQQQTTYKVMQNGSDCNALKQHNMLNGVVKFINKCQNY